RWWAKADRIVTDQAPWVPVFNETSAGFVSSRVGNYQESPEYGPLLDQMWVRLSASSAAAAEVQTPAGTPPPTRSALWPEPADLLPAARIVDGVQRARHGWGAVIKAGQTPCFDSL